MKENFATCLAHVLKFEGGKSDNPADPGGRTKNGVTHTTYDAYRARKGLPLMDVYRMPAGERDEIYRHGYWDKIDGDNLPEGIDLALMDLAVNSGPGRALRMWKAMEPSRAGADPGQSITKLCNVRLAFMRGLRTWPTFGAGWSKRVQQVEKLALAMAAGDPLPKSLPPGTKAGGVVVAGGAAVAAASTGLDMAIAWVIGILILAVAGGASVFFAAQQMRPSGAPKAHEPETPPIAAMVPMSLAPELDAALADLEVKKAAYDAALAAVAAERERVKARIVALGAALVAMDDKRAATLADDHERPQAALAASTIHVDAAVPDITTAQKAALDAIEAQVDAGTA